MQRFMPREPAQAQALRRRRAAVHALPDREPDRVGVFAQGRAALRRLASSSITPRRWCPSTSTRRAPRAAADIETTALNTNLEAADEIARQLRSARHRRPHRHRLHRHGVAEEPARRRRPAARRREAGPRAHPDRAHLALRPARDVAPAPAAVARRVDATSSARAAPAWAASAASSRWRSRSCA